MGWFITDQGRLYIYFVWLNKQSVQEKVYRLLLKMNSIYETKILPKPVNQVGTLRPIKNPYNAGGTW